MQRTLVYELLLLQTVACASSSSLAPSSDSRVSVPEWQSALQQLAASGTSIYSFRFDAPPPTGTFYELAVHDVDSSTACARYGAGASQDGSDADFWLLDVTVNDANDGVHSISLSLRDGHPSVTANVRLLHRHQGTYVENYDAVAGSVSVTTTPSPDDARRGAVFGGVIQADFPYHGMQEVACMGGMARDAGVEFANCTCRDADGGLTTCTPVGGNGENCCHDLASPRIHVTVPFSASSCPNMCRWAAGLATDYCYQYFGP